MVSRQVVRTVRANWIVALVTFLACLFIGGAYAVLPAKTYTASVVPPSPAAGRAVDPALLSAPFRSRSLRSGGTGEAALDDQAAQQVPSAPPATRGACRQRRSGLEYGHHKCLDFEPRHRAGLRQRGGGRVVKYHGTAIAVPPGCL